MEYIICFLISTIILYLTRKRGRFQGRMLAVLFLSLLAGFRAPSVGADTGGYPLDLFEYGTTCNNLKEFVYYSEFVVYCKEIGYISFVYAVTRFFSSFNIFLFITSFLVNVCICNFLYWHSRKLKAPLWLMWLSYCFLFYNHTLTLSKQSLAISFGLIAYIYIIERKIFKGIISQIMSFLMHYSSVFSLTLLVPKIIKGTKLRIVFLCSFILIVFGGLYILNSVISAIPLLDRFNRYTNQSEGDLAIFESLFRLLVIFWILLFYRKKMFGVNKQIIGNILFLFVIEFEFFMLNAIYNQAGRLSFYIFPMYFVYIPFLLSRTKSEINFSYFYVLALVLFWSYTIIYQGSTMTYPYESIF